MRLQISTKLAIFAVLELTAREGSQLSVAEIGEKYGVSSHHLAKVMHVMGRAGLVRAVRGAGREGFRHYSRRAEHLRPGLRGQHDDGRDRAPPAGPERLRGSQGEVLMPSAVWLLRA